MYTIELTDGTKLEGLTFDGNIFQTSAKLTRTDIEGKRSRVKISSDDETQQGFTGEHGPMRLVTLQDTTKIAGIPDGTYFKLVDLTEGELASMKLAANLEYVAMMSDIDLEV